MQLGRVRNYGLFSNHWLDERLRLESEWKTLKAESQRALDEIAHIWASERERVGEYSEAGLEEAFVHPVLHRLGWRLVYQTYLRGRRPDYAFFLSEELKDQALQAGRKSQSFWEPAELVGDAKSWLTSLDRPIGKGEGREYPPEQIEWYLVQSGCAYGLITNGRLWRLYPRDLTPHQARFDTYLECNLARMLERWIGEDDRSQPLSLSDKVSVLEDFHYFFLFFGPAGFARADDEPSLVERAVVGSNLYRLGVGEGLKERVFEALRLCTEGFFGCKPNDLDAEEDITRCTEHSLALLYRLLFVMYGEDRGLLPLRTNRLYRDNRSLSRLRSLISTSSDRQTFPKQFPSDGTEIWEDLQSLFDIIDTGAKRYSVAAYDGGLFDTAKHPFLAEKVLPNEYAGRVIDQLGRAPDPEHPDAGLFRVDYRDLSIQHLGYIYEGLLELKPHVAAEPLVVVRKRESGRHIERIIPAGDPLPSGFERTEIGFGPGEVYLTTSKGERRASGSYYTPGHIVDHIIWKVVEPLCRSETQKIEAEIESLTDKSAQASPQEASTLAATLADLENSYQDRILSLRILDPSMGSGHFLLSVCQYLAEEIATSKYTDDAQTATLADDESILSFWKRRVAEQCIFGVDKNPLAVELAKVALWLATSSVNRPLTFIDHHLRRGDSLVGGWTNRLGVLPHSTPLPLLGQDEEEVLTLLTDGFRRISAIPSDTAEQVKAKESILNREIQALRKPLEAVAELWCSFHFTDAGTRVTDAQYNATLRELTRARGRMRRFWASEWYTRTIREAVRHGMDCFHWELEFPEIFFRPRHEPQELGFDAVVGNPPYDVLSEKEIGRDVSYLRDYLKAQPVYRPSFRGKNNLYKLFVCQVLRLLRQGGRLGFITPMPILGDDQALGIRQAILEAGTFTSVDAFPQKDNPSQRVFAEAKLSTAVVAVLKTDAEAEREQPFVARVHPGREIEDDSPSLQLSRTAITLYDPSNLTIVSCDQADWDLAVRIVESERTQRLGDVCKPHQGEVNEKTAGDRGLLSDDSSVGPQVLRGANVCLYVLREASQGDVRYLNLAKYLEATRENTRALHHTERRIGFQRSSPQNNFRRLIACETPAGKHCFDTVSYVVKSESALDLAVVLALLNSKLLEWFFRLGSTNSKVNNYQFENLPCPVFSDDRMEPGGDADDAVHHAIDRGSVEDLAGALQPDLASPPFGLRIRQTIAHLVEQVIAEETSRGEIGRAERSALSPKAAIYQAMLDRIIYEMVGLSASESQALEDRLERML